MIPIKPTVRPLPYYSLPVTRQEQQLAAELRREFVPKITRRLPGHHLRGFRHDFIVSFVRANKRKYPLFLRTDIAGFYANIRHTDLIVGTQLAYRDLLGLDYVPSAFKKKYVGRIQQWCNSLPGHKGIPLGSPLSAFLAPLMLIPLWLNIKKLYGVPFLVYMDDILILTENEGLAADIYSFLSGRLYDCYGLELNNAKTSSGRMSRTSVEYCGWVFAGGYARVSDEKVAQFKRRIVERLQRKQPDGTMEMHSYIAGVNRLIDGFGNYYKHGDVMTLYVELDTFIRHQLRRNLFRLTGRHYHSTIAVAKTGIRTLEGIKKRQVQSKFEKIDRKNKSRRGRRLSALAITAPQPQPRTTEPQGEIKEYMVTTDRKLTQIVGLMRKQINLLGQIFGTV